MTGAQIRAAALATGLLLAMGAAACSGDGDDNKPTPRPTTTSASATPSATPSARPSATKAPDSDPLTGGKKNGQVVVAVKIDNVAAARPQVGIDQADIIVVERVEADLTRLMAIFHTDFPRRVGPVRSARNTDVQFLPMFGKPALVFSGANRKVLKQVRSSPYIRPVPRDRRDYSRVAPHNVIVNAATIAELPDIGKAQPIGYTFGDAPQWKKAAKAGSFKVKIGVDTFGFDYSDGHYNTAWNGQNETDGDSGKPVLADNIVRLSVKSHQDTDSTSKLSNVAETVGSGKVTVYSRGKKLTGTWSRKELAGPMTLKNDQGDDIALHPGKTWILLDG